MVSQNALAAVWPQCEVCLGVTESLHEVQLSGMTSMLVGLLIVWLSFDHHI